MLHYDKNLSKVLCFKISQGNWLIFKPDELLGSPKIIHPPSKCIKNRKQISHSIRLIQSGVSPFEVGQDFAPKTFQNFYSKGRGIFIKVTFFFIATLFSPLQLKNLLGDFWICFPDSHLVNSVIILLPLINLFVNNVSIPFR